MDGKSRIIGLIIFAAGLLICFNLIGRATIGVVLLILGYAVYSAGFTNALKGKRKGYDLPL